VENGIVIRETWKHNKEEVPMMRTQGWVAFLLLIGASLYAEEKRTITVCALNDAATITVRGDTIPHIGKGEIKKIVRGVSREYKRNVGIALKLVEYHDTLIPMNPAGAYAEQFRSACNKGEIVAVFTNQEGTREGLSHELIHYAGYSESHKGIVWSYEVTDRTNTLEIKLRNLMISLLEYHRLSMGEAGENPTTTLKHEIAHLFGVDHSPTNIDFMYGGVGSNAWSERIREIIKKNRDMKWGR
jgi:hypothetical protein